MLGLYWSKENLGGQTFAVTALQVIDLEDWRIEQQAFAAPFSNFSKYISNFADVG